MQQHPVMPGLIIFVASLKHHSNLWFKARKLGVDWDQASRLFAFKRLQEDAHSDFCSLFISSSQGPIMVTQRENQSVQVDADDAEDAKQMQNNKSKRWWADNMLNVFI